jgi:hypothetical protein
MLSQELKDLIRDVGGKFIIAENGKASYVAMSLKEFQKSIASKESLQALTEEELVDKINNDIAMWRESQESGEEDLINDIEKLEDIEYV